MARIEPIPWDEMNPKERKSIESGIQAGAFTDPLPLEILAYATHGEAPDDGDRHPNFPKHLLGGRLLELMRIRSAQLGRCEPCTASRKVKGASEDAVAFLTNPAKRGDLSDRELHAHA